MDASAESIRRDGRPALLRAWLVRGYSSCSDELLKLFVSHARIVAGTARTTARPATTVNARRGVSRRETASRIRRVELVGGGQDRTGEECKMEGPRNVGRRTTRR